MTTTAREPISEDWHWRSPEGFEISTDIRRLDFEAIYSFIAESYWAKGISRARLKKADLLGVKSLSPLQGREAVYVTIPTGMPSGC